MNNKKLLKKFKKENPDILNELKSDTERSKKRLIKNEIEGEEPIQKINQIKKIVSEDYEKSSNNNVKLKFTYEIGDVVYLKGLRIGEMMQFVPYNFSTVNKESYEEFIGVVLQKRFQINNKVERTLYEILVDGRVFIADGICLKTI